MKKIWIVANWKSHKTLREAEDWFKTVKQSRPNLSNWSNLEIVLAPPFTLLYPVKDLIEKNNLPITLCAQDISPFPDGAYNGEVSGRMLKDAGAKYVFVGHPERRKYFKEDEQMFFNKIREAIDNGLEPIFFIDNKTTPVPEGVKLIFYEPIATTGSSLAIPSSEANEAGKILKQILGKEMTFLYAGFVNAENVSSFIQQENIDGFGMGRSSLDAEEFLRILNQVQNDVI